MIVGDAAALYPHRGARGQNGERRALLRVGTAWIAIDPLPSFVHDCLLPSAVSRKTTLPLIQRCERPHYTDERAARKHQVPSKFHLE